MSLFLIQLDFAAVAMLVLVEEELVVAAMLISSSILIIVAWQSSVRVGTDIIAASASVISLFLIGDISERKIKCAQLK